MKRRSLWLAAVAGVAAATGAGWSHWQRQRQAEQTAGLWSLRFERPEGGELPMDSLRGRPLVLNFWATWCAPCVRELPELDRFHRDYGPRGWRVVGLAIDGAAPVRDFLRRVPVGYPIGLAGLEGADLVRRLGNPVGGLPFSVLFGRDALPVWRKVGETSYDELAARAAEAR